MIDEIPRIQQETYIQEQLQNVKRIEQYAQNFNIGKILNKNGSEESYSEFNDKSDSDLQ